MLKRLFLGVVACYGICGANGMDVEVQKDAERKLFNSLVTEEEYIQTRERIKGDIPYYIETLPYSDVSHNMNSFVFCNLYYTVKGFKDVLTLISPNVSYVLKNGYEDCLVGAGSIFSMSSSYGVRTLMEFAESDFCEGRSRKMLANYLLYIASFFEANSDLRNSATIIEGLQQMASRDSDDPLLQETDRDLFDKIYFALAPEYNY